jgi:hypothetical protein
MQGQLYHTMVKMQQTILQMYSIDERTQSRKRKNDTQGDASNTLDERTMKQHKASGAQQVGYDKQIRPLSDMSHDYRDFFSFVPSSMIGGIQCTTCGQKVHHFEVCLKHYTLCVHCEHYGHYSSNCPMKNLTPSKLGIWLFKRQAKDDTLSQATSQCSLSGSPRGLELEKASEPVGHISRSSH